MVTCASDIPVAGGYAFAGWQLRNDELERDEEEGFYLTVQPLQPVEDQSETEIGAVQEEP